MASSRVNCVLLVGVVLATQIFECCKKTNGRYHLYAMRDHPHHCEQGEYQTHQSVHECTGEIYDCGGEIVIKWDRDNRNYFDN